MQLNTQQISHLLPKSFVKLALALALSSALVSCDSNSNHASDGVHSEHNHAAGEDHSGHDHAEHEDNDLHIESAGRLAVLSSTDNTVNIINLDDQQNLGSFSLGSEGARLYASPEYRYVLAFERNANLISVFDSGLYTEDHGDHLHDYQEAPTDTGIRLNGVKPTHFTAHEEHGVIFNDAGNGVVSSVTVLSDELLTSRGTLPTLELSNSMHGVAKLIEGKLFVTYRDSSITDTTLPAEVERYSFDGSNFTLDTRYNTQCPLLHGAAANEEYLIFGCGDGILSINLHDADYSATHYSNPDFFAEGERIGSVYSHHAVSDMIGAAGRNPRKLVRLSPEAEQVMQPLTLPDNDSPIVQGFNQDGDKFYALSSDGQLHFYNSADWTFSSSLQVIDALTEESSNPVIITTQVDSHLYLLEPDNQRILIIDSEEESLEGSISLDFPASALTWVGLSAEHEEHGHEH
ncbi:hypothetical protein [Candidatus Albibeggiatoa sp. nov. NOAA]|uniref:hypothetical protein n=1 Tax=Candidatus Albibeggiatoa sp. nov. NOAA TaxID=3162724 RepID=UPI0032F36622|nr:hypothetical protein [Thiotrichaceae bacterium]